MYEFDLHNHTTASDGVYSPAELVRLAAELGLQGLAITDHDTLDGLSEAAAEAQRRHISLIFGVELSCAQSAAAGEKAHKVHLLGLFVDLQAPELNRFLREEQIKRFQRGKLMLAKLAELGMPLDEDGEMLQAYATRGAIGRGLIGRKLVEAGFAADTNEAFERWVGVGKPAYVPRQKVTAVEAIGLVHRAGGLAVIAHPVQSEDDRLIGLLAAAGLDGLECCHPDQPEELEQHYRRLAAEYKLAVSGGSDCHTGGLGEFGISRGELLALLGRRVKK